MIQTIVVFEEKNSRTFSRMYRVAAFWGVPLIIAVETKVAVRGNLFSAKGQVEVVHYSEAEFVEWQERVQPTFIACDVAKGEPRIERVVDNGKHLALLMMPNRHSKETLSRVENRFNIRKEGLAPELTTDQAVAVALYETSKQRNQ